MEQRGLHREHPLDSIYTIGLINLPAFVLGFPLSTLAGFVAFRGLWAIYIHSNVRLPLGPLRMLIGAPELHHWHHDCNRDAGNYANISPLMDILFGTYHWPDHEPERFGTTIPCQRSYLGHLLVPLLPASLTAPRSDPAIAEGGLFATDFPQVVEDPSLDETCDDSLVVASS